MSRHSTSSSSVAGKLITSFRIISLHLHRRLITRPSLPLHRRNQINKETKDIKCENKCDGPFEDRGGVVVGFASYAEGDCEGDFNDDEEELDPEGGAEDAVFAEVWGLLVLK